MARRQSIEIPGFSHANPIPGASRIGNIVMSSVMSGRNPDGSGMPEAMSAQVANVFTHIRSCMEAAGGSVDDIIKITFFVEDPATGRAELNDEWVKMFPDADSRPARHTQRSGGGPSKVSCNFVAVID